jgi:hypothetical protein
MKHASLEALLGQLGEEALDGVQPRGRSRREVEGTARMTADHSITLGCLWAARINGFLKKGEHSVGVAGQNGWADRAL